MKTLDGIPYDDSLNIYTDGSSFPGLLREPNRLGLS